MNRITHCHYCTQTPSSITTHPPPQPVLRSTHYIIATTTPPHSRSHPPLSTHHPWDYQPAPITTPTSHPHHSCCSQNALLRLHGRSALPLRRRRLKDHAHILHCMDAAISREGVDSLTHDNLKNVSTIHFFSHTKPACHIPHWTPYKHRIEFPDCPCSGGRKAGDVIFTYAKLSTSSVVGTGRKWWISATISKY